jgi:hypothetical protein
MTQNAKTLTIALASLILGLAAVLGILRAAEEMTAPIADRAAELSRQAAALEAPDSTAELTSGRGGIFELPVPAVPATAQPTGAEPLTAGQIEQVRLATDRVCEGMTAGVPLVELEPALAAEFGLDGVLAHEFVKDVAWTVCPGAGR